MSQYYQLPLQFIDPLLKLSVVEAALRKVMNPAPSRPTIYEMWECGELEGMQVGPGRNLYIYSASLDAFILRMQQPRQQKLAA